jgi:N-methylhydantoinase B
MTTKSMKIDPVIVAVIERRLYGIVTQVAESLVRTSMSPIFAEARDIGAGLFDKDMRLIALQEYLPAVAGSIIPSGREVARYWRGEIREGDIFAHNDVWSGNSHQPDITVANRSSIW